MMALSKSQSQGTAYNESDGPEIDTIESSKTMATRYPGNYWHFVLILSNEQVYWENAVQVGFLARVIPNILPRLQIISPHDTGIASAILGNLKPRFTSAWDVVALDATRHPQALDITQTMYNAYFALLGKTVSMSVSIYLGFLPRLR
jgi:hypothetical protein